MSLDKRIKELTEQLDGLIFLSLPNGPTPALERALDRMSKEIERLVTIREKAKELTELLKKDAA